jgi:hypothetical protein
MSVYHRRVSKLIGLIAVVLLLLGGSTNTAQEGDWTNINGTVRYNGTPVCAMVLANGQYMFTCGDSLGLFDLEVPLDGNGQITVYAFCSGMAPFKQIIYPADGENMQIELERDDGGRGMGVTYTLDAINTTWARLSGEFSYNGTPLCAMALANGQYMFTCSGDGSFSLDVPLDSNGGVTFYGFCSGFAPYKYVFTSDEISFDENTDGDDYFIAEGDCNDLDRCTYPGATEICGDGIDQDCNGSDLACIGSPGVPTGIYGGTTDENDPIIIAVSGNGHVITDFVIWIEMSVGMGTCTAPFTTSECVVEITGSSFEVDVSYFNVFTTVRGSFNGTTVSGGYDGYSGSFSIICGNYFIIGTGTLFGDGTWEAEILP